MLLKVVRHRFLGDTTIGQLYVNGRFFGYTLEDAVRNQKIYGQTAIPYGTYTVKITYSPRFKRLLPLLLNVPLFKGVRIHTGNKSEDTSGCLLVGQRVKGKRIYRSKYTFNKLFALMQEAQSKGETIRIEIVSYDKPIGMGLLGLLGLSAFGIWGYRYYQKQHKIERQ